MTTIVVGGVIVLALALWKLRLVVFLLLLSFTIAAAMRPGVDALARRRVPRAVGVFLHYAVVLGALGLFLSLVVPHLVTQVQDAVAQPQSSRPGTGVKDELLNAIDMRLRNLPSARELFHPAVTAGQKAVEVVIGIFFVFAGAAYWIFEREAAVNFVTRLLPRPKRKKVRETWDLIDAQLGAFVRGQIILISFVAVVVSLGLWAIGEPYWLLLGIATGVLEIVPVIGPLAALLLAVGAGLTQSWQVAALAAATILGIRLLQDYFVTPRVLGSAVGISPLLVLVSVFATGILLGGFYVLLAIPLAAAVMTLVDVIVLGTDPADIETPAVLFTPGDAEAR